MPEIGLFIIGALVTTVTVAACLLVGRQEAEDSRRHASERVVRPSERSNSSQ